MKIFLIILKTVAVLAVIVVLIVFIQRGLHSQASDAFPNHPYDPQLVLKQSIIVGWDHGQKLWQFSGDELAVDHQGQFLNYSGNGQGTAFYENKPFLSIRAPQLRFDVKSQNLDASKGVVLSAKPATVLRTQELIWDQNEQKLFIPGQVYIQSPYGKFKGEHLTMFAYVGKIQVQGVKMMFDMNKLPQLQNDQRPLSAPRFFPGKK